MSSTSNVYFILACARSGSTSLTTILNEATNGVCQVEPAPNLNWETREMMEGRLSDPDSVIESLIAPRVAKGLKETECYGEKNLTYGPFIPYLYRRFNCKFVLLVRDGANVVRSLMDWHNNVFGSVYRECKDPGTLSPRAISAAANLPVHLDLSDYSRPRPQPGSREHEQWESYTREQMCAWYWQYIYALYLDELDKIPTESWIRIDYEKPKTEDILRVADFLNLKGLEKSGVTEMLDRRINSMSDRGAEGERYPDWADWTETNRQQFRKIVRNTSERLGISIN